ncbi:MAG: type II toxin-antitoxin system PemK/MazF family toxin [Candidatus Tumulicola sp.]
MTVRRGEIWWVELDPAVGSELRKKRPCVVVQRDAANAVSPTTIICPLTSAIGKKLGPANVPLHPGEAGLKKPSLVLCNQVRVVDVRRLSARVGTIGAETLGKVERGLRAILDL